MKICPEQINGLQKSQEQQKTQKTENTQQAFDAILGKELNKSQKNEQAMAVPSLNGLSVNSLLATQAVGAVESTEEQALSQVESTLDSLESYASKLGGEQAGDLKQAYAALEAFQSDIAELKGTLGNSSGLQSMVEELEILGATEQLKFNRGDYL